MATAPTTGPRAITPIDVSHIPLYTEDSWRQPFATLRADMPLSWCPDSPYGGYWSATTHALIQQIELDTETFSSSWENGNIVIADPPPESNLQHFIALDPPKHTEQRRVIAPAFNPSQMASREADIRTRTKELFDALPQGERFDWVERVSIPLTIGMLCILFGIPWEERHDLKRWSDWASNISPETQTEEYRVLWQEQMGQMMGRFGALLHERAAQPLGDDLLSRMVHSAAMGDMTPMEQLSNIALLIVAGNDTTRNSMSGFIEALTLYPDQWDVLCAEPALIPNAVQEIIRWQSPVTHMRRTATRDVELAGQGIKKGEKIILWYISGNRDDGVFPDAERFDVRRDNARRHVAFGHGIHRCVGARLAEIQIGTLIEEMIARRLRVTLDGPPVRLPSPFLHGFSNMPVVMASD
jgi:cytochrome P450